MSINQCSINSNQVDKFINTFSRHYQAGAGLEHAPPGGMEGVTNLRQRHSFILDSTTVALGPVLIIISL